MQIRYFFLLHFLLGLLHFMGPARSHPEPLHDYCVADTKIHPNVFLNSVPCINPKCTLASHFATSALSEPGSMNRFNFNVTLTKVNDLPGLNTLGLAMARVDIAINGLVPPHSHPRASEVTILLRVLF